MTQIALFPEERAAPEALPEAVQVRLKEFELHRPRQWGACWLALDLWEQLQLDAFWQERLPPSRKGTSWLHVLRAQIILTRSAKWSWLKAWAMKIAKNRGLKRAIVALARRLAVIMHRIWVDGTEFRWTKEEAVSA